MSASAPRSTRTARLSVRVPAGLKDDLRDTVDALQARGQRTSESELVEMLVTAGIALDPDDLEARLRDWRRSR